MTLSGHERAYRSTVRLYPRDFRRRYGEDLVQHFGDLITDRGPSAAWTRTTLDLLLTVPRYRPESVMTETHSATTLAIAIALAVAQRTTLARAIRTPDTGARRRRLTTGAMIGCPAFLIAGLLTPKDPSARGAVAPG